MKTPASSTGCSKTGKRVKNLRALLLLCFGLMFAGTIAAGETGPDLLLGTDIRLKAGPCARDGRKGRDRTLGRADRANGRG